ncbi:MAG: hypothetical protein KGS72_04305 [Cyanobacteria bacterium REEB67]|nr:hypothetical protein [Cyanobacteria bacterium REEB67]
MPKNIASSFLLLILIDIGPPMLVTDLASFLGSAITIEANTNQVLIDRLRRSAQLDSTRRNENPAKSLSIGRFALKKYRTGPVF